MQLIKPSEISARILTLLDESDERVIIVTAMKVDMHPGPEAGILQLSGQAQQPFISICITGILEAEAAYLIESVRRFIDSTDNLVI